MTERQCTIRNQRQADVTDRENQRHSNLIKRAKSDPGAFAELYELYYEGVFHYCIRRLFDRHGAEDVTSTVFFKVMRNLDSFEGDAMAFRNWLLRIATNAVNDHLRHKRMRLTAMQRVAADSQDEAQTIEAAPDLIEKKTRLKRALLGLKPKYQTVIALRFFENMKLAEIGLCLGEKPSTIRTRLSRATAMLRQKLDADRSNGGNRP